MMQLFPITSSIAYFDVISTTRHWNPVWHSRFCQGHPETAVCVCSNV